MSTLARREREKLQRKNDILNAAEKKFIKKGFDNVSMDEIAKDLELSKPTIYLYFKNKESLYFAVVIRQMNILKDIFTKAVSDGSTGVDKVQRFIRAFFFEYAKNHPEFLRLVTVAREQRFMNLLQTNQIEGAKQFGTIAMEMLTLLIDALKQGISDGTVRKDLDTLQTAIYVVVTCESTAQLSAEYRGLLSHRNLTTNTYLEHSINLMLKGIIP